jgi:RNA polymerase sigma factor (sigma-70 family)
MAAKPPFDGTHGTAAADRELANRFVERRDEAAFRELFRRHTPALYQLGVRLLGGTGRGAEDAVQEAWLRAAKGLAAFQWRSSLRTWLTGITINCCRERLRERRAGETAELGGGPAQAANPMALCLDLERAVLGLPDGFREVFVLHEVEGFTHEEIAARLGIEVGTSKSQLSRARRALRSYLSGSPIGAVETRP